MASQTAIDDGEVCIKNTGCDNLSINDGVDVTTKVKGGTISADIEIRDFTAHCSGDVTFSIAGITGDASFLFGIDAPQVNLKATLGDPISISKCKAEINLEDLEINDVTIAGTDIPEKVTDHVIDMLVKQGLLELVNDQAGDGKKTQIAE